MSEIIQAVHAKTAALHMALSRISPVRATDPVKSSKDLASLVVCTQKKFLSWRCRFFVSDVISGGLSGHLGPLHLALGPNR